MVRLLSVTKFPARSHLLQQQANELCSTFALMCLRGQDLLLLQIFLDLIHKIMLPYLEVEISGR